ncbi:MAG: flagellar hook assembly protein FlgD [Methylococcaceae bacterium]|nr:flagellar hook assembly protein FlgD [Methylococcaceae bacterium]
MSINLDTLKELGLQHSAPPKTRKGLGQEEFLKLMTTQLTHQDPGKPMESGDFLAQIAQFSTVSGIKDLQEAFARFAESQRSDQGLQAGYLVGRDVLVPADEGLLAAGANLEGQLIIPGPASTVTVDILDSNGQLVKKIELGPQADGNVAFDWDGSTIGGSFADPGSYKVRASAVINGTNTGLASLIRSNVESVTLGRGGSGITLNVAGAGPVPFSEVYEIH